MPSKTTWKISTPTKVLERRGRTTKPDAKTLIYCFVRWSGIRPFEDKECGRKVVNICMTSSSAQRVIVQELCESWGGRPGLSVLTSLLVSVDVKLYWTILRLSLICQLTSEDIKQHCLPAYRTTWEPRICVDRKVELGSQVASWTVVCFICSQQLVP